MMPNTYTILISIIWLWKRRAQCTWHIGVMLPLALVLKCVVREENRKQSSSMQTISSRQTALNSKEMLYSYALIVFLNFFLVLFRFCFPFEDAKLNMTITPFALHWDMRFSSSKAPIFQCDWFFISDEKSIYWLGHKLRTNKEKPMDWQMLKISS